MTVIISVGKYIFFMREHSIALLGLVLLSLAVCTAALVATQGSATNSVATHQAPHNISATTAQALHQVFEANHYIWPPTGQNTVPPLLLTQLPKDFAAIPSANQRRELFLRSLLPIVLIENRRLQEQRALASWLLDGNLPIAGSPTHQWLISVAKQFRVRGDLSEPAVREKLLGRLDIIPPALALAQGAIESGWGSSRFALEGNSLFGQWTFDSKGLEPSQRDAQATHLVASFPDLQASVRAYMRNLNTGNAYHEFRTARALARRNAHPLQAAELAAHLHRYSQRGEEYVTEIRHIMRSPSVAKLAQASLKLLPQNLAVTLTVTTPPPHTGS